MNTQQSIPSLSRQLKSLSTLRIAAGPIQSSGSLRVYPSPLSSSISSAQVHSHINVGKHTNQAAISWVLMLITPNTRKYSINAYLVIG
jgi:hypothetical protein